MKLLKTAIALATFLFTPHAAPGAEYPAALWTNQHPNVVSDVVFAPDGASLASGSYSGPAKLWNVADGSLLRGFSIPSDHVVAVAFSPEGLRLVGGGGDGFIRMWVVTDGSVLYSGGAEENGFGSIHFNPTGTLFALGRENETISVRYSSNGFGAFALEGHNDFVRIVRFSPDGNWLGSASGDNSAKLWRMSDQSLYQDFSDHPGPIWFTPDGKYFVFGNADGTSSFWDLETNGVARVFPGWGSAARFSPDGKLLLTISSGVLKFWRVSDGHSLITYDGVADARSIDISPDGKLFAYGTGGGNVVLARMPLFVTECTLNGGSAVLRWTGGSGLYQLQSCTNLLNDSWQNVGPATTNTAATNLASGTVFYRVQSLFAP